MCLVALRLSAPFLGRLEGPSSEGTWAGERLSLQPVPGRECRTLVVVVGLSEGGSTRAVLR